MAAENTLLFGASAIRCSSRFHLQNPDLLRKRWMSWPCYCFFPFSHLFFLPVFFPFHWRLKLCLCWAPRQILPLLCSLFQITLKSDAGFGQSPLALGFCAAVRVRSYDLWFADDMSNASLVAVAVVSRLRWFCKAVSMVQYDVTEASRRCYGELI